MEVRSPEDYGSAAELLMADKRTDYFAAGTHAVWDVDQEGGTVCLHRATDPTQPVVFSRGEQAHPEPVLPGWALAVDDPFHRNDRLAASRPPYCRARGR